MTPAVAALVEDVEWLLSTGEHPDRIATRLGMTRHALTQAMRRAGRRDLANPLDPNRSHRKRTP